MLGIPQTAVWGSFKSSLQTMVLRKNGRNPPNGSLGIVQVLTTDDGSAQEWSESPKRQFGDRSSPHYRRWFCARMVGIPQTAVWGSFKSSLQTTVLRKNGRNPPNGSLGIVQVLTTDDGSAQEWSESPKRQFGDRSSPYYRRRF